MIIGFEVITGDWFSILNMALFAITNGYNSTLLMIYGPMMAKEEHREKAGIIMGFNLVGGIFFGALVALGMGQLEFTGGRFF